METIQEDQRTKGLCHRCEYRALFHERGLRPRSECGDITLSVRSCYMFKPVKPFYIEVNEGEKRPLSANILSARYHHAGECDMVLALESINDKMLLYWKLDK